MMRYTQPDYLEPYGTGLRLNNVGKRYKEIGIKKIKEKGLCVIILAGGQGTRLGTTEPKGCYVLPEINTTLFHIHSTYIKKAQEAYDCEIKLFIMTSEYTHSKTIEYFKNNENFGLKKENIIYFQQENSTCHGFQNEPIPLGDGYATSPNGNGDIFRLIKENKIIEQIKNVKYCNVISVDNILARTVDPIVIGYMEENNLDVCNKSVTKRDNESVGIFLINGDRIVVREYSEIDPKKEYIEMSDPPLKIQGNICNHTFTIDFMNKVGNLDLPFHKALKKIPYSDENGDIINPTVKNGYKNEKFIFDCLEYTTKSGILCVPRSLEFSPVKNGLESDCDNPKTAVKDFRERNGYLFKDTRSISHDEILHVSCADLTLEKDKT